MPFLLDFSISAAYKRYSPAFRTDSQTGERSEVNGMYAVIKTGGKQYKVSAGDLVKVEKLDGAVGDTIELAEVLMVGGAEVKIGTPLLPGAKVKARIVEQDKDKKILVFKSKRRKFQRKLYGHRQPITRLQITAIEA